MGYMKPQGHMRDTWGLMNIFHLGPPSFDHVTIFVSPRLVKVKSFLVEFSLMVTLCEEPFDQPPFRLLGWLQICKTNFACSLQCSWESSINNSIHVCVVDTHTCLATLVLGACLGRNSRCWGAAVARYFASLSQEWKVTS